jgi:hypothetical protein
MHHHQLSRAQHPPPRARPSSVTGVACHLHAHRQARTTHSSASAASRNRGRERQFHTHLQGGHQQCHGHHHAHHNILCGVFWCLRCSGHQGSHSSCSTTPRPVCADPHLLLSLDRWKNLQTIVSYSCNRLKSPDDLPSCSFLMHPSRKPQLMQHDHVLPCNE